MNLSHLHTLIVAHLALVMVIGYVFNTFVHALTPPDSKSGKVYITFYHFATAIAADLSPILRSLYAIFQKYLSTFTNGDNATSAGSSGSGSSSTQNNGEK